MATLLIERPVTPMSGSPVLPADLVDVCECLAAKLRHLRLEKSRSQERFADEAGNHLAYAGNFERGTCNPTIEAVERLAQFFEAITGALVA